MRSKLDTLDYAAGVVVRTFLLPLTVVMGFGWMIVGFIGPWLLAIYLVALVIDYLLSTSVDAGWRLLISCTVVLVPFGYTFFRLPEFVKAWVEFSGVGGRLGKLESDLSFAHKMTETRR